MTASPNTTDSAQPTGSGQGRKSAQVDVVMQHAPPTLHERADAEHVVGNALGIDQPRLRGLVPAGRQPHDACSKQ